MIFSTSSTDLFRVSASSRATTAWYDVLPRRWKVKLGRFTFPEIPCPTAGLSRENREMPRGNYQWYFGNVNLRGLTWGSNGSI